jgi:ABC-type transporter Mla subunit MlaD
MLIKKSPLAKTLLLSIVIVVATTASIGHAALVGGTYVSVTPPAYVAKTLNTYARNTTSSSLDN